MVNPIKKLTALIIFVIIITFPYLVALKATGDSNQFGGFLLNPIDGNTYLAKMRQGFNGQWLFNLPYTSVEGKGVFLFSFYLFLGHIARWFNFSLIFVFHAARILSATLLFFVLSHFIRSQINSDQDPFSPQQQITRQKIIIDGLLLGCFGAGLGWLAALVGILTPDFWVAEAFPFLSAFTSPHFSFGMALLLIILGLDDQHRVGGFIKTWFLGVLLAVVMPFGAVLAGIVFLVTALWSWKQVGKIEPHAAIAILIGGGMIVGFQYWDISTDPLLSVWNAQNVTPSPDIGKLILGYLPSLLFAVIGIEQLRRKHALQNYKKILGWLFVSFLLVIFPFSLQRRFMFAQFIPIAIIAILGLSQLPSKYYQSTFVIVLVISVMTNVFIIFSGIIAVKSGNPRMVLSNDEVMAFNWLEDNTRKNSVVLCSPELGNFVPAYTENRVLYGHPFETVDAEEMQAVVISLYENQLDEPVVSDLISEFHIEWIILGPREKEYGQPNYLTSYSEVYANDTITIFAADQSP